MADRRVLLIDTDKQFAETLRRALSPYGVDVVAVDDGSDGIGRIRDENPELLVIAVELPKKEGYGLFSRAKKGAAKSLPVMLVTASVGADDFAKHQKLSTHAEAYVDKRTVEDEDLVRHVDALIQLGPPQAAELDMDLAVEDAEEFAIDEDLAVVEDGDGEEGTGAGRNDFGGEHTSFEAGTRGLLEGGIDAETDAAFAALGMEGEEPNEFDLDQSPNTALKPSMGDLDAPPPVAASDDDAAAEFGVELPELPADGDGDAVPEPVAQPKGIGTVDIDEESSAVMSLDDAEEMPLGDDLEPPLERTVLMAKEPEPVASVARPGPPPAAPPLAPARIATPIAAPVVARPAPLATPVPSAVPPAELASLKAEVERLTRELAEAKNVTANAAQTTNTGSREKDFKNLREMISRKEKELDDLKEEIEGKDKQIQQGKDKLKELDKKLRELEASNLSIQEDLETATAQVATLTQDKERSVERERGVKARLDASQIEVRKAHEEVADLKRRIAADQTAAADALAKEKAAREAERGEAASKLRAAEQAAAQKTAQLEESQRSAIAQLRAELESARAAAVAAVESDREARLAALAAEHEQALTALREEHAGEVGGLAAAHEEALQHKEHDLQAALQAAEQQRQDDLVAAEQRRVTDLAAAEQKRQADLAAAAADFDRQQKALAERHEDELSQADAERRQALAAAETRRQEQLAELEEKRVAELAEAEERRAGELAAVTTSFEAEREELKSSTDAQIAALSREIDDLRKAVNAGREREKGLEADLAAKAARIAEQAANIETLEHEVAARDGQLVEKKEEIEELETQNAQFQEQVLRAYQKIKSDDAVVQKAKKAVAIALTLLDEQHGQSEAKS